MKYFEVSLWSPYNDIENFVPTLKRGTRKVYSFLDFYLRIALENSKDYSCRGRVHNPSNYGEYVPWLYSSPYFFINKAMIFTTTYDISIVEEVVNRSLKKICVGDNINELIVKCNTFFPYDNQDKEIVPFLGLEEPAVSFETNIVKAVPGCSLFHENRGVNLVHYVPEKHDDFDLYVEIEVKFISGIKEIVHITVTTPKRLTARYDNYFKNSNKRAEFVYGTMVVSEYNYKEVLGKLTCFFDSITGSSETEVLLKIASSMDVSNLDYYLQEIIIKSGSAYRLLDEKINRNYR